MMKKDLCYFYPVPVEPVFDAFVQAAKRQFGKNCKIDAYKTLNFGLDYSFKYNMNGGSLTLHFMPYQGGTAIDMRYTMVQLVAGRYQKQGNDVLAFTDAALGVKAQPISLDINQFLAYEASTPSAAQQPVQPVQPVQQAQVPLPQQPVQYQPKPQPVQQAYTAPARKFCVNCGAPLTVENAAFCMQCGCKL